MLAIDSGVFCPSALNGILSDTAAVATPPSTGKKITQTSTRNIPIQSMVLGTSAAVLEPKHCLLCSVLHAK